MLKNLDFKAEVNQEINQDKRPREIQTLEHNLEEVIDLRNKLESFRIIRMLLE